MPFKIFIATCLLWSLPTLAQFPQFQFPRYTPSTPYLNYGDPFDDERPAPSVTFIAGDSVALASLNLVSITYDYSKMAVDNSYSLEEFLTQPKPKKKYKKVLSIWNTERSTVYEARFQSSFNYVGKSIGLMSTSNPESSDGSLEIIMNSLELGFDKLSSISSTCLQAECIFKNKSGQVILHCQVRNAASNSDLGIGSQIADCYGKVADLLMAEVARTLKK